MAEVLHSYFRIHTFDSPYVAGSLKKKTFMIQIETKKETLIHLMWNLLGACLGIYRSCSLTYKCLQIQIV